MSGGLTFLSLVWAQCINPTGLCPWLTLSGGRIGIALRGGKEKYLASNCMYPNPKAKWVKETCPMSSSAESLKAFASGLHWISHTKPRQDTQSFKENRNSMRKGKKPSYSARFYTMVSGYKLENHPGKEQYHYSNKWAGRHPSFSLHKPQGWRFHSQPGFLLNIQQKNCLVARIVLEEAFTERHPWIRLSYVVLCPGKMGVLVTYSNGAAASISPAPAFHIFLPRGKVKTD